jgi:hypothetical protein
LPDASGCKTDAKDAKPQRKATKLRKITEGAELYCFVKHKGAYNF